MTISAFGVDHGAEVSKATSSGPSKGNASFGRHVTTQAFPMWHGAIAGRPGKKLRSASTEAGTMLGGAVAGGTAGALAGRAITRGRPGGALVGGAVGGQVGGRAWLGHQTNRNNKLGRYNKQT